MTMNSITSEIKWFINLNKTTTHLLLFPKKFLVEEKIKIK